MRTLVQFAGSCFERDKRGTSKPFDPFFIPEKDVAGEAMALGCAVNGGQYEIATSPSDLDDAVSSVEVDEQGKVHRRTAPRDAFARTLLLRDERFASLFAQLQRVRLVRLDPDALRASSGLIPETDAVGFLDDRGHGLAGVFFALRNRDDTTFASIVADMRRHFPTIRGLRVKAMSTSEVALEVELVGGMRVDARRMSEGFLYYLAFAALRHLDPVSLLLVEEPENGLHPARIAEVVRILREISRTTQVVLATHSPLVVNELRPEEVSVVTRTPEEGTKVKRIHETPDFEARSKIYALGELWIAYANGEDEAPLLEGTEP
jgi:hypothetical protein